MHFISLACLITLARTYNNMLNKNGENENPYLVKFQLLIVEYGIA